MIYTTDGHCRLRGLDLAVSEGAEIDLVPMVVSTKAKTIEDITVGLVRSASGKPLEALEKAAVCKRLSNFGWDERRIAERLGMTATYVHELLTLIGAPAAVREMVAADKISATAALQAMATHGDKVVEKIAQGLEKAQASGKTRVTTRFLVDPGEKVIAKEGPKLFSVVQELREDPGFTQLGEPLQKKLTELLNQIEGKRQRAIKRAQLKQAPAEAVAASPDSAGQGTSSDPTEVGRDTEDDSVEEAVTSEPFIEAA